MRSTSRPTIGARRRTAVLVALSAMAAASGCALFGEERLSDGSRTRGTGLPPIPTAPTAVQLDIVSIERPTDDPLLGRALWGELDTVSSLEAPLRRSLRENGFRVGVSPSSPPRALQTLLGLTREIPDESNRLANNRIVLPSGGESEMPVGLLHAECLVHVPSADGRKPREFRHARGVLRVKAHRRQEGWVRLEFLPEIHHGQLAHRPTPAERGEWKYRTTQEIESLYSQRFSLDVNLGDMVVVSGTPDDESSLGRLFFIGSDERSDVQRVLVVRLSGMADGNTGR